MSYLEQIEAVFSDSLVSSNSDYNHQNLLSKNIRELLIRDLSHFKIRGNGEPVTTTRPSRESSLRR
jgi:hypothetical protein